MTTTATPAAAPFPAAVARALAAANDRPHPMVDAIRTPQKYAALARNFRDSAWEHLDKDDLAQASNKAWGLVAETVKDISAQHGRIIHTHQAIMKVVDELALLVAGAGDPDTANWIAGVFLIASRLHINFYEDELTENIVIGGLMQCEELADFLRRRFGVAPSGVL